MVPAEGTECIQQMAAQRLLQKASSYTSSLLVGPGKGGSSHMQTKLEDLHFYSGWDQGWESRTGSYSEPVPTNQFHRNRTPPTLSILLNDYAPRFPVYAKNLRRPCARRQPSNNKAASWRVGSDPKSGSISPNAMKILPYVISAMLSFRVRVQTPATC